MQENHLSIYNFSFNLPTISKNTSIIDKNQVNYDQNIKIMNSFSMEERSKQQVGVRGNLCHIKVIGPLIDIHSNTHVFVAHVFNSLKF